MTAYTAGSQLLVEMNRATHAIVENHDQAVIDTRIDWLIETWLRADR